MFRAYPRLRELLAPALVASTLLFLEQSICLQGSAARPEKFPMQQCHLEIKPASRVNATLRLDVRAPNLSATDWTVYEPCPPNLEVSQRLEGCELLVSDRNSPYTVIEELSQLHRPIIQARIPVQNTEQRKRLQISANYRMALFSRRVVPGAGRYEMLSIQERDSNLQAGKTLDFEAPAFKDWMQRNQLVKAIGERDIDFSWRVFQRLRHLYSYNFDEAQSRVVSNLCKTNATDCGGLSFLYCALMRANSIPARPLIGRWLKSDPDMDSTQPMRGEFHVKAEVFCDGVGWVPVDMALAVTEKNASGDKYFGEFDGTFICFHSNPDILVDSLGFGKHEIPFMQSPLFWVKGEGNLTGIDVKRYWQTRIQKN